MVKFDQHGIWEINISENQSYVSKGEEVCLEKFKKTLF